MTVLVLFLLMVGGDQKESAKLDPNEIRDMVAVNVVLMLFLLQWCRAGRHVWVLLVEFKRGEDAAFPREYSGEKCWAPGAMPLPFQC